MNSEPNVRYVIDAGDKISYVDEGWCHFANANGSPDLMPPSILGQSLWDHITDRTTSGLYRQLVARARQGNSSRFTLRCDGPTCRRLLEMTLTGRPDGSVEFETHPINVEPRESVTLLSTEAVRSGQLLRACSWCNQVDVGFESNEWVEVEDAAERLRLFENGHMPRLTHGICDACNANVRSQVAGRGQ